MLDGAGEYLSDLVRDATTADATQRTPSVADFIDGSRRGRGGAHRAERSEPEEIHPLEAAVSGDMLGPYMVDRRLGRGSTAVALLVEDDDDQPRVLKVATDPDRNDRVRDEGEVLAKLRDRTIIAVHGEPIDVGNRVAIVLSYASEGTLAHRLHKDGRLSLGDLERWGDDLLSALELPRAGGHRPPRHQAREPRHRRGRRAEAAAPRADGLLALARARRTSSTSARARTWTRSSARASARRWDLAADRFAAAMVLHEMAAGTLPYWGSPNTDPRMVTRRGDGRSRRVPARDRGAARRACSNEALRRDARSASTPPTTCSARGGGSSRRRRARARRRARRRSRWRRRRLDAGRGARSQPARGRRARPHGRGDRRRPAAVAGLHSCAASGVDAAELVDAQRELRDRLGATVATATTHDVDAPDVQALDALVGQLVPRLTSRNTSQVEGVQRLLGLEAVEEPTGRWPSHTEVAHSIGVTRARVGQIVAQGRERWRRLPAVTRLRDELLAALTDLGGVAAADELEAVIAGQRGGGGPDNAFARAAVRAAVEVELAREAPRLAQRRSRRAGPAHLRGRRPGRAPARARPRRAPRREGRRARGGRDAAVQRRDAGGPARAAPAGRAGRSARGAARHARRRRVAHRGGLRPAGAASARAGQRARAPPRPQRAARRRRADGRRRAAPDRRALPRRAAAARTGPRSTTCSCEASVELRWDAEQRALPRLDASGARRPDRPLQLADALRDRHEHAAAAAGRPGCRGGARVRRAPARRRRERRLPRAHRLAATARRRGPPARHAPDRRTWTSTACCSTRSSRRRPRRARAGRRSSRPTPPRPGASTRQRLGALVQRAMPEVEQAIAAHDGAVLLRNPGLLARYGQLGLLRPAAPAHPRRRAAACDLAPGRCRPADRPAR